MDFCKIYLHRWRSYYPLGIYQTYRECTNCHKAQERFLLMFWKQTKFLNLYSKMKIAGEK